MPYIGKVINACGNKSAAKRNLEYKGDFMTRGKELAKIALQDDPDFIFISDWAPVKMSSLTENLQNEKYKIYLPNGFENEKELWRWTSISAMAIREGTVFSQTYLDESKFPTNYRYISGVLQKEKEDTINVLGVHIPQVDTPDECHLFRKRKMLNVTRDYMAVNTKNRALVFGDFNSGSLKEGDEPFYCQKEFDDLMGRGWFDTNIADVKTYGNKKIDHCFASPFLVSEDEYAVIMVPRNIGYKNLTDHKILDVKISRKKSDLRTW
jgi:endonuclease/exonuclease/phosphatase (EEP) superfamily protein YafD